LWRRLSPARRMRKLRRMSLEMEQLLEMLPRGLSEILQQVQTGRFHVQLDHSGLEPSVNRLVLGMLSSALFLGSALLLSHKAPPLLTLPWSIEFSVVGALGCVGSIVLGARALRAIN